MTTNLQSSVPVSSYFAIIFTVMTAGPPKPNLSSTSTHPVLLNAPPQNTPMVVALASEEMDIFSSGMYQIIHEETVITSGQPLEADQIEQQCSAEKQPPPAEKQPPAE